MGLDRDGRVPSFLLSLPGADIGEVAVGAVGLFGCGDEGDGGVEDFLEEVLQVRHVFIVQFHEVVDRSAVQLYYGLKLRGCHLLGVKEVGLYAIGDAIGVEGGEVVYLDAGVEEGLEDVTDVGFPFFAEQFLDAADGGCLTAGLVVYDAVGGGTGGVAFLAYNVLPVYDTTYLHIVSRGEFYAKPYLLLGVGAAESLRLGHAAVYL